jgi:hypothetical protein
MSEQNQKSTGSPDPSASSRVSPPVPTYGDWHEQRYADRAARREARRQRRGGRSYAWVGGAILILVGLALLLQNMGIPFLENWWALFILIPGLGFLAAAWDSYRDSDRLTRRGAGLLAGGVLLTILAVVFLFGLDFGLAWPVLLIVGGLVLLGAELYRSPGES